MEPFKAPHFEGPSGFPAFAAGGAIGGIGGSAGIEIHDIGCAIAAEATRRT